MTKTTPALEKSKNTTISIGEINTLEVMRDTDYGYFLEAKDEKEVLLPNVYVMEDEMPMGSLVDVFIYTDSEDRPVATTKMPYAKLGEYGYFTVVDYKAYGAFVNWGLPKDLFVPLFVLGKLVFNELKVVPQRLHVRVYLRFYIAGEEAYVFVAQRHNGSCQINLLELLPLLQRGGQGHQSFPRTRHTL
jgi:hypothetical protein